MGKHANRIFGVTLVAVLFCAGLVACQPLHMDVLVYGDSLTVNAQTAHGLNVPGKLVGVRAMGGTALCDWVPAMASDRKLYHPHTVVIAFVGNVATCVANDWRRSGSAAATANYERALRAVRVAYPTEKIVVVGSPAMNDRIRWLFYAGSPQLNAMEKRVASQIRATYTDAADVALSPHHVFVWDRPPLGCPTCRPVRVRTSDGVHLTAAGGRLYGAALLTSPSPSPSPSPTPTPTPTG